MRTLAVAAAFFIAAPGLTPAAAAEVNAVASFTILGDMVRRVGGDRVDVTTIVGPNGDTHVYEPRPADAVALSTSDIFFVNGLGFEGWLERLVEATGFAGPVVTLADGLATRTMEESGDEITDPHAWQSLGNARIYVDNIAVGLCKVDAAGCGSYRANAERYMEELAAVDAELKARIAAVPPEKRRVITTHDAFGYFGAAYGIEFLAPEGISTESEASAAGVARLIEQVRTLGVTALFVENMSDPRLVEQIARETGAKVGGQLYSDSLSEEDGPAPTYLDMFKYNIELLVPALEGK